ncbi:hypothetical protein [Streptomyces sp. NBC_01264]|uniref:hypothetical protein n=1 Tax=Streptomyces sp. NBC_01264 TaxID=2903804 RepID=UPI0022577C22|nr:hypothetical protein [Streptomyces sp. NBC_01264]MCX4782190.1 hypothetical protein [Streptomyces sp. NBC_01264]
MDSDKHGEYDDIPAVIRVHKGARLTRSRKTEGAYRGMTRDADTNQLGQAEIFLTPREEPDPEAQERREKAEFLAEMLVHFGLLVVEKAGPPVRTWWYEQALPAAKAKWNDQALPAVKARWSSVARALTSERRAGAAAQDTEEVVTVPGDRRSAMRAAEARERISEAVLARVYSDEQIRLVRNARIVFEGQDGPVEPEASDDLTPQRIGEYVALMLEANPSLLGVDTLAELGDLVAKIRADGGCVPVPGAEGAVAHLPLSPGDGDR